MDQKRVTAQEAKRLIDEEGYTLLDVRSTPEYVSEHPEGAYNVPYLHKQPYGMVANPDFARVVTSAFPDRSTKLITSCAMGGRSLRAAAELTSLGYTQVIDLRGGFEGEKDEAGNVAVEGWKNSRLPVEKGEPQGRAYAQLYAKITGPAAAAPKAEAPSAGGHGHGHGHSHSHGQEAPGQGAPRLNRFADPKRTVLCAKLQQTLPALKRRPLGGELGQRIYDTISAEAWEQWAEHSKLIINEYRLNPADPKAQELLIKQCEEFLFGKGAEVPEEFRPQ